MTTQTLNYIHDFAVRYRPSKSFWKGLVVGVLLMAAYAIYTTENLLLEQCEAQASLAGSTSACHRAQSSDRSVPPALNYVF